MPKDKKNKQGQVGQYVLHVDCQTYELTADRRTQPLIDTRYHLTDRPTDTAPN